MAATFFSGALGTTFGAVLPVAFAGDAFACGGTFAGAAFFAIGCLGEIDFLTGFAAFTVGFFSGAGLFKAGFFARIFFASGFFTGARGVIFFDGAFFSALPLAAAFALPTGLALGFFDGFLLAAIDGPHKIARFRCKKYKRDLRGSNG